eukprot:TRINITY_DN10802_c0_g2_i7.p1 TRINITY_DN10802_c0_g2~~TRINITY_DN10802_c0_g2_i7.p1  ORF type:complete len:196 (+),score=15.77 TRINITY_DN10802_c0_g2_i7:56-589(+)
MSRNDADLGEYCSTDDDDRVQVDCASNCCINNRCKEFDECERIGVIVGSVFGGLFICCILFCVLWYFFYYNKRNNSNNQGNVTVTQHQPPTGHAQQQHGYPPAHSGPAPSYNQYPPQTQQGYPPQQSYPPQQGHPPQQGYGHQSPVQGFPPSAASETAAAQAPPPSYTDVTHGQSKA